MPILDSRKLAGATIPVATGGLLGACMEARGKQDLWIRQKPAVLDVLREQAIVQSVESSNRIEGVTVAPGRLRPLVIEGAKPRDRSEEEIAGYRTALNWIYARKRPLSITPDILLHLHSLSASPGDAGEWKKRDNEIIEILPSGDRSTRFVPVSAKRTPAAIEQLCAKYRLACEDERVPPLLVVAAFVFDFLCVHPFRNGNGRVSRLTTALLLQSHGFQVARYISLEKVVEDSREEYYRALKLCSQDWHEGKNEIVPWWNFFLGMLRTAYKEFGRRIESAEPRPAKTGLVRQTVLEQVDQFALSDLAALLPSASSQLIRKVLTEMKKSRRVRLVGRGRGARWEVNR